MSEWMLMWLGMLQTNDVCYTWDATQCFKVFQSRQSSAGLSSHIAHHIFAITHQITHITCLLAWQRSQQRQETHLICSTDPHLEESLGLGVEGTPIRESGQQDVGSPILVHPVISVLRTHKVVLKDSSHGSSGECHGEHLMCTCVQHQRSITEAGMLATNTPCQRNIHNRNKDYCKCNKAQQLVMRQSCSRFGLIGEERRGEERRGGGRGRRELGEKGGG